MAAAFLVLREPEIRRANKQTGKKSSVKYGTVSKFNKFISQKIFLKSIGFVKWKNCQNIFK